MINSLKERPHSAEIKSEPKFRVEVIQTPEKLVELETERVNWYLLNFPIYEEKGYSSILRFPSGIEPGQSYSPEQIKKAVQKEMDEKMELYLGFATKLERCLDDLIRSALSVVQGLYGYSLDGEYSVVPTAYGTIDGQLTSDGPIFFRLPEYRPSTLGNTFSTGSSPTYTELLTHEILAHGVTAKLRDGTTIDESLPRCTHQQHKEYLMDLLGRTILTRSNLMHADDVAMQIRAMQIAQKDIDPLYFDRNGNLSWEGDLQSLVQKIDRTLKGEK